MFEQQDPKIFTLTNDNEKQKILKENECTAVLLKNRFQGVIDYINSLWFIFCGLTNRFGYNHESI